jgi:hypothetical protein
MLYVKSRKGLNGRKGKKSISLLSEKNTWQTCFFAECMKKTLVKEHVYRLKTNQGTRKFSECFFLTALGNEFVA